MSNRMKSRIHDLQEIKRELDRIKSAGLPSTIRKWPFSPSERDREAQRLFSELDVFWDLASIELNHRIRFKAAHKGLNTDTLNRIWQEHEFFLRFTHEERTTSFKRCEKAVSDRILLTVGEARAALAALWVQMKMPAKHAPAIVQCKLGPEHLTLETVEFHEVKTQNHLSVQPLPPTLSFRRTVPLSVQLLPLTLS